MYRVDASQTKPYSPACRFGHLGHFSHASGHQGFLEGSLFGGHAVIPFFSPICLLPAAGDGGIAGTESIWMICAAVAALGYLAEKENEREKEKGREREKVEEGDGQSRNFHEVLNLFCKR